MFVIVHRFLDLPIVCLIQDCTEYLLDPHCHLPTYPLLLVRCPIPLSE
jgi:hypothetical protein